jgi:predicted O-methyltransferase YrrM
MSAMFNNYSHYYDLLYSDKDYVKEADYIKSILRSNNIEKGNLLEFGSGTGKHGCLLASNGYIVHGIERSAEMVAIANTAKGFSCQQGEISTIKMDNSYDAILSLFHVVSYQTTNVEVKAVFTNAAKHLNSGGLFVFDFWFSPAVLTQRPEVRVKRIKDTKVEITRLAEPKIYTNDNRVDVKYTIFVRDLVTNTIQAFEEIHPMRHFNLLEIDILSDVHGFERVQAEEFLTGNLPSEKTWGVCVVLRKI